MKATIKNMAFHTATGNLAVNQLMEREVAPTVTSKATFSKEPKWTTMMAKKVHHVVSQVVETLANAPKQDEHKLNLRLTNFEAKEGEIKKELVERLNIKLLEGQMKLCTKAVIATWH
jgi:hypothetical protein